MMARRQWGTVWKRPDRGNAWYCKFPWDKRRITRYGGRTWHEARKKLTAIRALKEQGVDLEDALADVFGDFNGRRLTFKKAAPLYLEYAKARKKASTYHRDSVRLDYICKAPWATKELHEIRAEDLTRWLTVREKDGASPSTRNRYLSLISVVYRWAIQMDYVTENPVKRVQRFSEKGREREVYLTAQEANALIDVGSAVLRPLLFAAIHTGMRRGELLSLSWSCVDLKRREILISPKVEKSGRGRVIPMTTELHKEMKALRRRRTRPSLDSSDPVFVLDNGLGITEAILRRLFASALTACKTIPLSKRQQVTFHSLRHTAASLMVGAAVPIFDVSKLLGHSTVAVTMRYAHFAPEAGRAGIDRLGETLRLAKEAALKKAKVGA